MPVRFVLFLQVVVLFALAAFVVLLQLENPVQVRVPLPGGQDLMLPLGVVVGAALLLGALYASLLFLPRLVLGAVERVRDGRARRDLEQRLSATLQAKLTAPAVSPLSVDTPVEPDDTGTPLPKVGA